MTGESQTSAGVEYVIRFPTAKFKQVVSQSIFGNGTRNNWGRARMMLSFYSNPTNVFNM